MDIPKGLEHEITIPKKQDYHGHPNYLKIYLYLIGLFVLTLFASFIENTLIVFIVVFSISTIKGIMVLLYFMHLKWEPNLIWYLLVLALLTLLFLIIGLYPDITLNELFLVK